MEPVTHVLMGATLARSGVNRKAAYATLTMAIAAEFPDIDMLWGLRGPVASFQHHRGITHTFLGIPFEAALLVVCAWALHRWRGRRPSARPLTKAPVRWGMLYAGVLLALLSHIFLDWTNNYGVRPFFPFNPRWYAGSFVYIFDPLLFAVLLLCLGLPSLFRLIGSEVGARQETFRGRGMAMAALGFVAAYYGVRAYEHGRAVQLAMEQSIAAPGDANAPAHATPVYLAPQRVLASPDPLLLFRWYTVTDYGPGYQLGTAYTRQETFAAGDNFQPKPDRSPAVVVAEESAMGRVYLDWSPTPFIVAMHPSDPANEVKTYVTFRDPRFMGDATMLHPKGSSPFTATVALDGANRVMAQTMDGSAAREQNELR